MGTKNVMIVILPITVLLLIFSGISGQYSPAAGETGTTAIHKDNQAFIDWATTCTVERGYLKISDTNFVDNDTNRASHGFSNDALGIADGAVVSLGDGGSATMQFSSPISNNNGPDFAVFENSFKAMESPFQFYLELAFVEVSSDGSRFVRFPSYSNNPQLPQVETFGQLDPTLIHNLAGKYIVFYGTPFDLDDIADSTGVNLNAITHVRIVDVVGSVSSRFASYDSQGNKINDPWPTPFASGGFDLDAVGVLDGSINGLRTEQSVEYLQLMVYPNPVSSGSAIHIKVNNPNTINSSGLLQITDYSGRIIVNKPIKLQANNTLPLPTNIKPGAYLLNIITKDYFNARIIHIVQ